MNKPARMRLFHNPEKSMYKLIYDRIDDPEYFHDIRDDLCRPFYNSQVRSFIVYRMYDEMKEL